MKKTEKTVVELQQNDAIVSITERENESKEVNEVEELKKENERLKTLVSSKQEPENLEEKIKYFEKKQELINRRNRMELSVINLKEVEAEVKKESEVDAFISENFSIKVTKKPNYGSEQEIIKFKNPVVIAELIEFLIEKATFKFNQIEAEINA